MKCINYLESIAGIGIFPMISLLIFFGFFTLLIAYVLKADKSHIREMKNIPLEQSETGLNETV